MMGFSIIDLIADAFTDCSAEQLAIASAILFVAILYHVSKPLPVPSDLPGPTRYPWIGYLGHCIKHWHQWPTETTRLAKLYKRTWGGPLPNFGGLPGAYFYIHEERNLRHILKDSFDNYEKGDMWQHCLGEMLGRGIFAVDGEMWVVHRKLMSNMFSRNLLRHSAKVTRDKLFAILESFEERDCNGRGFDIDLQDVFFRLTIDTTCITTFGIDLGSVNKEEQHAFARAFDELSFLCQKRFLDPLFRLKKTLRLTWRERRIRALKKVIDGFAYEVIANKRRSSEEGSPLGLDLLSRFIEHGKKTNQQFTNTDLRDVIMNVMLAGRDTTASDEASRGRREIVDEVESVCGVGEEAEYTYDTMAKLEYTHCVAMEVLRLHPSVTNDPRFAVKDDVLPDGTQIPAGAGMDLCFYAMGRKEDIWGDDALQFRPERFLDGKEPSPFVYPVFNAGPRMCLGKPLALMNMKLGMAILLTSKFQFEDHIGHSGEYLWTLVESMKGGFRVNVRRKTCVK
ncbi:hypothetical protein ACHAXT_003344 [Thalassiosira profunda]